MEVFFLVGSIQALFFAILIFSKQSKNDADKILGIWLLMLGIQLMVPFLVYRNPDKFYYLGGIDATLFPASAIFMFLYTKTATAPDNKFKRKWLAHFLVLVVINFAFLSFYTLSPEEKLKMVHREEVVDFNIIFAASLNFLTFAAYVISTLVIIQKHKRRIRFQFSYELNIDLKWLRNLIYSLIVIGIIFVSLIAILASRRMHVYDTDFFIYLILVIFIFGLGYWGFKQGTIFPYKASKSSREEAEGNKTKKDVSVEEQLAKELHEYMSIKKPFLNPTLSLYDLASSMNWTTHELTILLNKFMETNFYEYVNSYRIDEVKKRLKQNNQKFTVLAIALDCGFNSKASFNRIFKQKTGLTPSDYVKRN